MVDHVESKYIHYYTKEYFSNMNDKNFSKEKFEEMYAKHPSRLTPEQIKGLGGYDSVRSNLWSKWCDTSLESLYNAYLAVATQVVEQYKNAIAELYPNLNLERIEGNVKKYGDGRYNAPRLMIGNRGNGTYLYITPTLSGMDDCYFTIDYNVPYFNGKTRYGNDVDVMNEIGKFNKFMTTGEEPTTFLDKVTSRGENQYKVYSGHNVLDMYDIQLTMFYHCIARDCNHYFGTDFKWSQKTIDNLYKTNTFGNIKYLGEFELKYVSPGRDAKVEENYYYLDDKTKKPTFHCVATYGDWKKEELIAMLNVLYPYIKDNYLYERSKENMAKKYADYDRIGIGYKEKPEYFDLLLWDEEC